MLRKYYANCTIYGIEEDTGYENKILIGEHINIVSEEENFILISTKELTNEEGKSIIIKTSKKIFEDSITIETKYKS